MGARQSRVLSLLVAASLTLLVFRTLTIAVHELGHVLAHQVLKDSFVSICYGGSPANPKTAWVMQSGFRHVDAARAFTKAAGVAFTCLLAMLLWFWPTRRRARRDLLRLFATSLWVTQLGSCVIQSAQLWLAPYHFEGDLHRFLVAMNWLPFEFRGGLWVSEYVLHLSATPIISLVVFSTAFSAALIAFRRQVMMQVSGWLELPQSSLQNVLLTSVVVFLSVFFFCTSGFQRFDIPFYWAMGITAGVLALTLLFGRRTTNKIAGRPSRGLRIVCLGVAFTLMVGGLSQFSDRHTARPGASCITLEGPR